jgi:hypothetical protein
MLSLCRLITSQQPQQPFYGFNDAPFLHQFLDGLGCLKQPRCALYNFNVSNDCDHDYAAAPTELTLTCDGKGYITTRMSVIISFFGN